MVTRWRNRPFVAFTMTDPEFARQGLARATLERSMRALYRDGEPNQNLLGRNAAKKFETKRGRELLKRLGPPGRPLHLLMDRAYEGNETRQLALEFGYIPVVPPLRTRVEPWEYDREMYKRRNEVERLFRRLKGYRRVFSRFEKLDLMFLGFISFVLVADGLRMC